MTEANKAKIIMIKNKGMRPVDIERETVKTFCKRHYAPIVLPNGGTRTVTWSRKKRSTSRPVNPVGSSLPPMVIDTESTALMNATFKTDLEMAVNMAKQVRKLNQKPKPLTSKLRVAAYVSVSMQSEDLLRYYAHQVDYYTKLIGSNPEWELAGIFSDRGITGTSTEKRDGFLKMLDECEKGNINIILTKSISRFSQNTLDLLNTIRHLKELGIKVRFEKENINSLSGDS